MSCNVHHNNHRHNYDDSLTPCTGDYDMSDYDFIKATDLTENIQNKIDEFEDFLNQGDATFDWSDTVPDLTAGKTIIKSEHWQDIYNFITNDLTDENKCQAIESTHDVSYDNIDDTSHQNGNQSPHNFTNRTSHQGSHDGSDDSSD